MMTSRTVLSFLVSFCFYVSFSIDCATLQSKNDCLKYAQCKWGSTLADCNAWVLGDPQNNVLSKCQLCACKSQVPLDMVFVIDSSGSIGGGNFELQKDWLKYLFDGKISQDSRLGFIIFSWFVNSTSHGTCNNPVSGSRICYWPIENDAYGDPNMGKKLQEWVGDMYYTRGTTITQKGIEKAVEWIRDYNKPNRKRIIILISDGQPNRPSGNVSVCQHKDNIDRYGIQVVVVGIGNGWVNQNGADKVRCLVQSDDDMFFVQDFNSFSSIKGGFFEILCPALNDLKITEIKVKRSDNIGTGLFKNRQNDKWRGRFLEIKNIGKDLDISQIKIDGFVRTNPGSTFFNTESLTVLIPQNTYFVFYEETSGTSNNNNEDDISCYLCDGCGVVGNCAEPLSYTWVSAGATNTWNNLPNDGNCQSTVGDGTSSGITQNGNGGRCYDVNNNPAVYIPCPLCSTNTWGTHGCCIDDTMTNTNWFVSINDTQGIVTPLDRVEYGTDNLAGVTNGGDSWNEVKHGYSYELQKLTANNDIGQNWAQSCYEWGTPGTTPNSYCPPKCDFDTCTNNNRSDIKALCGGDNICSCTAASGYYAYGIVCLPIPTVGSCSAIWEKIGDNEWVMRFKWSRAIMLNPEYRLRFPELDEEPIKYGGEITGIKEQAKDVEDDKIKWLGEGSIAGYIQASIKDVRNETFFSQGPQGQLLGTPCIVSTWYPTKAPTNEPTPGPTPAPSIAPTSSPLAGPRACFWQGCITNLEYFRSNVDYCECNIRNKQPLFNPPGFDKKCCKWNKTWDMGGDKLGKKNGKSLQCDLNPRYWLPSVDHKLLKIKCTNAPTLKTLINWEIVFQYKYCFKKCNKRRRLYSYHDRRSLTQTSNDTTSTDDGDFTLEPTSGQVQMNGSVIPPVVTVKILVTARTTTDTKVAQYVSVYFGNLTSCQNFGDGDPTCEVTYPNPIALYVSNSEFCKGAKQCANATEKKIPPYIWGVIGGLIAFLLLLAALIYFFWWKTAKAKKGISEAEEDIANEEEDMQQNVEEVLGTGDVQFNPMATMNANVNVLSNPLGNQMVANQAQAQHEFADVEAADFNYQEQYGQVQGKGHGAGF